MAGLPRRILKVIITHLTHQHTEFFKNYIQRELQMPSWCALLAVLSADSLLASFALAKVTSVSSAPSYTEKGWVKNTSTLCKDGGEMWRVPG